MCYTIFVEYTSTEIRAMSNSAPSRSLKEDLSEDIERSIHRQIAEVQLEAFTKINNVLDNSDKAYENLKKKNPEWSDQEIMSEVNMLINKYAEEVNNKAKVAIEALHDLMIYRLEELARWIELNE